MNNSETALFTGRGEAKEKQSIEILRGLLESIEVDKSLLGFLGSLGYFNRINSTNSKSSKNWIPVYTGMTR
jgi:hypothetical protein